MEKFKNYIKDIKREVEKKKLGEPSKVENHNLLDKIKCSFFINKPISHFRKEDISISTLLILFGEKYRELTAEDKVSLAIYLLHNPDKLQGVSRDSFIDNDLKETAHNYTEHKCIDVKEAFQLVKGVESQSVKLELVKKFRYGYGRNLTHIHEFFNGFENILPKHALSVLNEISCFYHKYSANISVTSLFGENLSKFKTEEEKVEVTRNIISKLTKFGVSVPPRLIGPRIKRDVAHTLIVSRIKGMVGNACKEFKQENKKNIIDHIQKTVKEVETQKKLIKRLGLELEYCANKETNNSNETNFNKGEEPNKENPNLNNEQEH